MSSSPEKCPVCGGDIDQNKMRCSKCYFDVINYNLNKTNAKIKLQGNSVTMQTGIIVALSFGIFSIIPVLRDTGLSTLGFWLYFLVLLGFEIFGLYTLERFLNYRNEQTRNDIILNNFQLLKIINPVKIETEISAIQHSEEPKKSSTLNLLIWGFKVILSEKKVKVPYTKYLIPAIWATYIISFTLLDLIIIITNSKSGLFLF
jgi:predicted nucleic acid-binding Zn ribbon protein